MPTPKSRATPPAPTTSVGVLDRTVAIIDAVEGGARSFTAIAQATGLTKPTTHRLINALQATGCSCTSAGWATRSERACSRWPRPRCVSCPCVRSHGRPSSAWLGRLVSRPSSTCARTTGASASTRWNRTTSCEPSCVSAPPCRSARARRARSFSPGGRSPRPRTSPASRPRCSLRGAEAGPTATASERQVSRR